MASGIKPMDVDGREEAEQQLYTKGPLSVLTSSVKTNSMVRAAPPAGAAPAFCSEGLVSVVCAVFAPCQEPDMRQQGVLTDRADRVLRSHLQGRFRWPLTLTCARPFYASSNGDG
jgi:hypothetical protein